MVIIIKWGKIKTESKAADDDASDSWKGGFHMSGKKQIGLGIAALAAGAGIAAVAAQGRKTSAVSREAKRKTRKRSGQNIATPSVENTKKTAREFIIQTAIMRRSHGRRSRKVWMKRAHIL